MSTKTIRQDKDAEKNSWVVKEIKEHQVHDPYDDRLYMSVIERILKPFGKRKIKILDLGCGSSAYGIRFARLGHHVVGVDISKEAVESAKKRARTEKVDATFIVGDIEKLDFEDSSFDMCFFGGVLHHFPDITNVMNESIRVLNKRGYIVCVEPNRQNPHVFLSMEPKSLFRYKHLTVNERSIDYREILDNLGNKAASFNVFYELMTLTSKGRHATKSFFDKNLFYSLGGFVFKYVKGGLFRKIIAVFAYNLAHIYQRMASIKRYGNFVILSVRIKK